MATESLENLVKALTTKIELLQFTNQDTEHTLEKAQVSAIERHRKTLEKKLEEVHDLKVRIQEKKLAEGVSSEEVRTWTTTQEDLLNPIESAIAKVNQVLGEIKKHEVDKQREYDEMMAAKVREEQFKEQLLHDKAILEQKLDYEMKIEEERKKNAKTSSEKSAKPNIKLQKLQISKYDGSHTDWLRFWNEFESEIHAAEIPPVTKFSYLKELVVPKVRTTIDGLPFTTEGYERARNILKHRYGQVSEIVNAYVQNIMSLPTVHGAQPAKVHDFFEKLMFNVQSLETLGKLKSVNGYVRVTIDKLEGIRGDLLRTDDKWQEWEFPHLVEALRKWTERNPVKPQGDKKLDKIPPYPDKRGKNFNTKQEEQEKRVPRVCVYCEETEHRSIDCPKVANIVDRKRELSQKGLCFNCTRPNHKASECKSRTACRICQQRHHTSICNKTKGQLMTTPDMGERSVTYPVVVVKVNGVKCRALLDSGAGSSYASAALLDTLQIRPLRRESKRIEMMLGAVNKVISVYEMIIDSIEGKFHLETEVTKVDRSELLTLRNPRYKEMISKYRHLRDVKMDDLDEKQQLPVHLILGSSDYAKIKTETKPRIGHRGSLWPN